MRGRQAPLLTTAARRWEGTLAYRPRADQRSRLELLRYLSFCGIGGTLACIEGGFGSWKRLAERSEIMTAEELPAAMDRQRDEIAAALAPHSENDLATRRTRNPPGQERTLGHALLEVPLRFLVGYRMHLFLYARAVGADLWTPDAWYGFTMPKPPASG